MFFQLKKNHQNLLAIFLILEKDLGFMNSDD